MSVTHRLGCVLCLVLETLDSTGSAISLLVCTGLENGTLTLYGLRSDSVSHVLSFSGPLKKKTEKVLVSQVWLVCLTCLVSALHKQSHSLLF